ncbi:helix-turn-helix domain-containing protein [Nakamurella sp. YIM 132087]|uniref:Helix-turn-helix domain-containing protein n=1 Tax=Nakamurella alba TaxID=2665158 RepID=A0A7K1FLE9_9ACTN|nr:helix-turn-helix domain-containing protein [Nakamurella alba]MTD14971.1 helix-turn-helix domain-containing protein [Nakamurella alba]
MSSRVNERIAARLRALRAERGLSLDALAEASGVSRSGLSLIERAGSSPTAVVLDRIAAALDVPLSSFFEAAPVADPVARRADQPVWQDPATGYTRRIVSPAVPGIGVQLVEIEFPAGAEIHYDSEPTSGSQQQFWVLNGAIEFRHGDEVHHLRKGDCLAVRRTATTVFRNTTDRPARYLLVAPAPGGSER